MSLARTVELEVPARSESLTLIRQVIGGIADAEGWPAAFLVDVRLAVTEACSNVVAHAYPRGTEDALTFTVTVHPKHFTARVRDQGIGIVPRIDANHTGLGLGLPLMVALTSELRIRSVPDGTTDITMVFTVPPAPVYS